MTEALTDTIMVEMDAPPSTYELVIVKKINGKLWMPHEDEVLKELWAIDIPASQIGKKLGRPKNSVIGRASRLKLSPRIPGFKPGNKPHNAFPKKPVVPLLAGFIAMRSPKAVDIEPEEIALAKENVDGTPLMKLRGSPEKRDGTAQCRWILNAPRKGGEYLFCKATQMPHSSYCEHHNSRAFAVRVRT